VSDVAEPVPKPMRRLIRANSRALKELPGQIAVHVSPDEAEADAPEKSVLINGRPEGHSAAAVIPNHGDISS